MLYVYEDTEIQIRGRLDLDKTSGGRLRTAQAQHAAVIFSFYNIYMLCRCRLQESIHFTVQGVRTVQ